MIIEITCYFSEGTSAAAPTCFVFVGLCLNALIVPWIFLPHKSIATLARRGEPVIWTVAWDTVGHCTSVSILVYDQQFTASHPSHFQP